MDMSAPDKIPEGLLLTGLENLTPAAYTDIISYAGWLGIQATPIDTEPQKEIITQNQLLVSQTDFHTFGERHNYSLGLAARSWGCLAREGRRVDVDDFSNYRRPNPDPESTDSVVPLTIAYKKAPHFSDDEYRLDVPSLEETLRHWLRHGYNLKPKELPRNLGKTVMSFIAHFTNEHLELENPLPVLPRKTPEKLEKPLLQEVEIDGTAHQLVTNYTFRDFAVSREISRPHQVHAQRLFDGIARQILGKEFSYKMPSHPRGHFTNGLFFLGSHKTAGITDALNDWGLEPARFLEMVNRFEQYPQSAPLSNWHQKLTRTIAVQYATAIQEYLVQNQLPTRVDANLDTAPTHVSELPANNNEEPRKVGLGILRAARAVLKRQKASNTDNTQA